MTPHDPPEGAADSRSADDTPKRPYHEPRLSRYGDLGEVTRGGAGSIPEMIGGGVQGKRQRP